MSISHIIDKGTCPPPWTRIRSHRLHSCTDIQFDRDLIGRVRLANLPTGNVGDYLQTVDELGVPTIRWDPPAFDPETINPGDPNQVFVTNALGTQSIWADDLNLPGNLTVTGLTNINGDLQFNGVAAPVNSVLTKTSLTDQAWVTPTRVSIIRYVTSFAAQNLNSAVGPTAVTFSVSPISSLSQTTIGVVTGISQLSTTQFSIGTSGTYDIDVLGYIDQASTGPVGSVVTLTVEIAGVENTNSCITVNTLSFVGRFASIACNAGNVIRILARRSLGTGTFTTFAAPAVAPNFASTITFTLVNTIG